MILCSVFVIHISEMEETTNSEEETSLFIIPCSVFDICISKSEAACFMNSVMIAMAGADYFVRLSVSKPDRRWVITVAVW
ncbi:MAG TPA: hypothetical protein VFN30_03940 [Chitinophagaceae bacterium]|nr:hypothetical protein [Chitinophagaceae bacterium]